MATVFPERIPSRVDSQAERKLYHALRQLPTEFLVLGWVPTRSSGTRQEGEVDFLVAHPDWGFLVLEVKGGSIGRDTSGEWYSIDRYGQKHRIKNPGEQAQEGAHHIRKKLARAPSTKEFDYAFGWCVVFPDVSATDEMGGIPRDHILDVADVNPADGSLEAALRRVMRAWGSSKWSTENQGRRAVNELRRLLAEPFCVSAVLASTVRDIEAQLIELTEEQYALLSWLRQRSKALICGCAGSGKTFLAVEFGLRLWQEGLNVLLLCHTRLLKDWLSYCLEDGKSQRRFKASPDRLMVMTFYELCKWLSQQCRISVPRDLNDKMAWARFLEDAVLKTDARIDALIVDEGQDFEPAWWDALRCLVRPDPDGRLYIFYDDNQRLLTKAYSWPIHDQIFRLERNVRSTREIFGVFSRFYKGARIEDGGVPGLPPWFEFGSGVSQGDLSPLARELDKWLGSGKVDRRDVVILTPRAEGKSRLTEGTRISKKWTLTWKDELVDYQPGAVLVSNIYRFKGLERSVVILVELETMEIFDPDLEQQRRLLYVGTSRARAHLIVLGGRSEWFRGHLADSGVL